MDPYLVPYEKYIEERGTLFDKREKELVGDGGLYSFAGSYKYFGFHRTDSGWVYREWAPAADALYLRGDFNCWEFYSCPMTRLEGGVFELFLDGRDALRVGQKVQTIVINAGRVLERIPLYATRVVQDKDNYLWCAELEETCLAFEWTDSDFSPTLPLFIYEAHVGMALERGEVGSYSEFCESVLPRIKKAGYNTLQLMAIAEHPYYGSFGYQVSNFFAPSSRYGSADDLRTLINKAHSLGITVLLDVVHSHAAKNTNEGINEFDGSGDQFFHAGQRGEHSAWGSKVFNYGKKEVLRFLLSNLRYWMEEFHFDGFRFDGVTSMLYHDHALGRSFTGYDMYFSENTDTDAVTYLQLANKLIHEISPNAITIAEDMSGMPGMCLPISSGGIGFDYRLSMGVPDMWIKLIKEKRDEEWDMHAIWYELDLRRIKEKSIGYCESHDQALVGDKTLIFRLCDAEMYTKMSKETESIIIERGMALSKMIKLISASLGGEGYLNFMGNEFGHPEWVDFPREGNGWSYHYCRRQWSLADDKNLRYSQLGEFDREMIAMLRDEKILEKRSVCKKVDNYKKVIIYGKGECVFAFNFSPSQSYEKYFIPVGRAGKYRVILSTDSLCFGGRALVDEEYIYTAGRSMENEGKIGFYCYLPSRCALVMKRGVYIDIG